MYFVLSVTAEVERLAEPIRVGSMAAAVWVVSELLPEAVKLVLSNQVHLAR